MSFLKKLLFLTLLLSNYLFAHQQVPHLLPLLQPIDDQKGRVYQSMINKDQTRILIRYHDALQLLDAKTLRVLKTLNLGNSVWDCAFVENGLVVLSYHDFRYYDATGNKLLYRIERDEDGQIYKMGVRENGYIIDFIKEIKRGGPRAVVSFNLRTKKYEVTKYKEGSKKSHFPDDIKENILKIYLAPHSYKYVNILTDKEVTSFPSQNILPDMQQKIDTNKLTLKDIKTGEVMRSFKKPVGRFQFGCISPSGKRFALLGSKSPLIVYDVNRSEPIFTLPAIDYHSFHRSCLLYGDTVVLQLDSLQKYDLVKDAPLYNTITSEIKVMPIIGHCIDKGFGIALWVSTIYGWDLSKGVMHWYNRGAKFDRSHWDTASYKVVLEGKKKWALIQPFGERAFSKELKVDLKNGSTLAYNSQKERPLPGSPKVCDPGIDPGLGKEFSFRHHGISFYAFSKGEWLSIDEKRGYFNASSKKVLNYLILDHHHLTPQEIKKWYRPDIIEATLRQKSTATLIRKKKQFLLPRQSTLINVYFKSMIKALSVKKNYRELPQLLRELSIEQFEPTINAIPNDEEGYYYFYRGLQQNRLYRRQLKELFPFLQKRAERLTPDSPESPYLLQYLQKIKVHRRYTDLRKQKEELINKVFQAHKKDLNVQYMLASQSDPKKQYIDIYWEVWERKHYIKEPTLELLYQEDPRRAEKLAIISLEHLLEYLDKKGCKDNQLNTKICQSDFEMRQYGTYATHINTLYTFLTQHDVKEPMELLLTLTDEKIKIFFKTTTSNTSHLDKAYLRFYMKYAHSKEKQKLIKESQAYLEQAVFKSDWKRYWSNRELRVKASKVHTLILSLEEYMPEYTAQLKSKILDSDGEFIHWVAK